MAQVKVALKRKSRGPFGTRSNNKGISCPFRPITCQEQWCEECQIYRGDDGDRRWN